MKLLFLLNSMRVSGTEKLMISLSKRFNENNHETYLFPLITPFDDDFIKAMEADGKKLNVLFPAVILKLDTFFWKLNGLTILLFNWSSRSFILHRYLLYKCKRIGIDLIVSNSHTTDSFMYLLHEKSGIKYVIIDHGSYVAHIVNGVNFDPAPLKSAAAVIGVSEWTVNTLKKGFPDLPVDLVYNGYVAPTRGLVSISLKQQLEPSGYFIFCMHGRGTEQKGWETAISAFYILKSKGYRVKLLLLAEGEYINSLKESYWHDSDLVFGGFHYNLIDIFDYVDAGLALSRKYETFGLTILDFFNSGIPVVASNVGGIPEVVHFQNLKGGLLVNVDEHGIPQVEETSEKMAELIQNKVQYQLFSEDAKVIAKQFSMEKCYEVYKDLFNKVISKQIEWTKEW